MLYYFFHRRVLNHVHQIHRAKMEYAYDHNGLRTQKKVTQGNVVTTTDYMLHGKLVMHMKKHTVQGNTESTDELHFFYDANSRPTMVKYNGVMYTYVHNLQGDIVAILDNNGAKVVEYKYDAWGKPLSTTGSMASTLGALNPFRYRGYVYDPETGLYYLRSRYYSCKYSAMLNLDYVELLAIIGTINKSGFSYASLNPVMLIDNEGCVSRYAADYIIRQNADYILRRQQQSLV